MSQNLQESIKNVFVLIGIGALIYAAITLLPPYYNSEKYQAACADAFGQFDYKWVDEKLYCKTDSGKWERHPEPPTATKYNVWGQNIE
jgi:hypothetical protein